MSKSGSKALSKSVDSVVKSVESVVTSVLPKNMNMKHVLLAILVGLLLCMLMGNTVEGLTCTTPRTIPTGYTGVTGGTSVDLGGDSTTPITTAVVVPNMTCDTGYTGTPKATCERAGTEMVLEGCNTDEVAGGTACSPTSGPYGDGTTLCNEYCDQVSGTNAGGLLQNDAEVFTTEDTSGYCRSISTYKGERQICAKKVSKSACEAAMNAAGCEWNRFEDKFNIEVLEDPMHLRNLFDYILSISGVIKNGCKSSSLLRTGLEVTPGSRLALLQSAQRTKRLPLLLTGDGATVQVTDDDDGWQGIQDVSHPTKFNDFFRLLIGDTVDNDIGGGKKKPISSQLDDIRGLPTDLRKQLKSIVESVEEQWSYYDEDGIVLEKNGGRIIAGYNSSSGFVIRNPPTKPEQFPGGKPAFHIGSGCPGSWRNGDFTAEICKIDSDCEMSDKAKRKDAIDKDKITNFFGIPVPGSGVVSNYCNLPSCNSDPNLTECTGENLTRRAGGTVKNQVTALFQ